MNNLINKSKSFPRPLWFMRQAGRYLPEYRELRSQSNGFLDMCLTPEKACEVTLQPLKRYPEIDAAILFSDILIIPYAMGISLDFTEGIGPVLNPTDLDIPPTYDAKDVEDKTAPVREAIRLIKPHLTHQSLIGFAGAPWTVATYMLQGKSGKEMALAKSIAYSNVSGMDRLIDRLTEATYQYLVGQIKSGVDMLQIFESWAGILPDPYFDRWCLKPVLGLIKRIKAEYPDIPLFVFPRGASSYYKRYFQSSPQPDGISIDTQVNMNQVLQEIPEGVVIQGGMDPQLLKAGGDPMLQEAERILKQTQNRQYIFNLGHGMTPDIPPENVAELITYVKRWQP